MSRTPFFIARRLTTLLAVLLTLASFASAEWKEKVLYSFQGAPDGSVPAGGVVFDQQGNLYGATTDGGASNCQSLFDCGTVFQLAAPAKNGNPWVETVLYTFKGVPSKDGASPFGGLVIDSSGNLYGTTGYGGAGVCTELGTNVGCGTVYELSPPKQKGGAWTETVLYSFQGDRDGDLPAGGLVFDSAGNLYGATQFGGGRGSCDAPFYQHCGTIFDLSPPKQKGGQWKEKVLYSFKGGKDGANPNGGLIFDSKGAIYGTTSVGGNEICKGDGYVGCGTVFKLMPPSKKEKGWTEEMVHRFQGGNQGTSLPDAGLVLDGKGDLYGTTFGGTGTYSAVFQLAPPTKGHPSWKETLIVDFKTCGGQFQCSPAGLMFDSVGNLYSSTNVIFRMKPPSRKGGNWRLTLLYKFEGQPDGRSPVGLVFGGAGTIYGATQYGGTGQACQGGCGTIF
jgi:hypothetical protein